MTNQEHILQQLSAYIDGELDAADEAAVEQALARDAELARELEQLKATRELLRRLPVEHAPEDFASRVLAQAERRHLVHHHAPARQGVNWLRYSLTAAVAVISVSVALVTIVGIYRANNANRGVVAVNQSTNASPSGEAVAVMDKGGEAKTGKLASLGEADQMKMNGGSLEADEAKGDNILICTDNLAKTRKELESELGKNAIQYQSRWAGDEEAVVVADLDSSQVPRLDKVINQLRSDNIGAELSGRQVRESRSREQAAADGKCKAAWDEAKATTIATKEGQKQKEPAKKGYYKHGEEWAYNDKPAESESAGPTPGAGVHADDGRLAKDTQPHRSPAKPGAAGAGAADEPTTRPASEINGTLYLADRDKCQHPVQKAPQSAPALPPAAQIAMATSQGKFNNLRNQSNQFALRVQITLQYHPALTQSFGGTQSRLSGSGEQNFNQTSQSGPADNAANRQDNSQQNLNR